MTTTNKLLVTFALVLVVTIVATEGPGRTGGPKKTWLG